MKNKSLKQINKNKKWQKTVDEKRKWTKTILWRLEKTIYL